MTTAENTPPAVALTKPTRAQPVPAKAELKPRRLPHWSPDHRWAHPVEAALWTFTLGVVASITAFAIPPWVLAGVGIVAAALGVGRARRAFPEDEFGDDAGSSMAVLALLAGVAIGGWLVFATMTSPLRAAGWLVLLGAWFGGWYAYLRTAHAKVAVKIAEDREEAKQAAQIAEATETWTDIFKGAGLALKVVETRATRAGYVIGVEPIDDTKPVGFDTLRTKLPELTVKAAAMLARTGTAIRAGDIRLEETEVAHVHLIHVCTKKVLALDIPFEPIAEPTTAKDPADFALYEDGRELTITYAGTTGSTAGKIIGARDSGKSTVANSLVGRGGECVDLLVGAVGCSKLVPLVYPWLKPWLEGKTAKPALDFVAGQDPQRVLAMLAALYWIVCDRNSRLSNEAVHQVSPEEPAIVVFVEEAGKMASRRDTILLHTKQHVGFSQLIDMICSEARSAQVGLFLLNQNDLYGSLGDFGAEIARNTPFRICLKTLAPQDGMSVLPGLSAAYADTSKLQHHSMLVQPSADEPRVMRAKAYRLVGTEQIYPIALRNAAWRPDLEPALATLLGDVWLDRWDAERLPELAAAARADGLEWPVGQPVDPIEAELHKMLEEYVEEKPAEETPAGTGEFPDANAAVAELTEIAQRPALTLPEPLATVMSLLAEPAAPRDWVTTQQLAVLLGRVANDAPVEDRKVAAQKLGRELSTIDDRIRSEPRDRMQGYDVPKLKKLAAKIARGES